MIISAARDDFGGNESLFDERVTLLLSLLVGADGLWLAMVWQ